MIIPTKHNGYTRDGVRRYHFGGGGGGDSAPPAPPPPPPRLPTAAPPPKFTTYGQGDRTGSLVQSGNSYRPSTLDYSKPIYDPNYADNITGYQDSSQFYQPIYQQQPANYTNPLTAFNVSNYGTNSGMSKSMREATAPGAGGADPYYKHLQSYGDLLSTQGSRNNINTLMQDMRTYGISAQDLQNASEYNPAPSGVGGGGNKTQQYVDPSTGRSTGLADIPQMQTPFNYQPSSSNALTPELARTLMQRAMTTGLPISESDKYGGYAAIKALYEKSGGTRDEVGQQVSTQPLQFNPYTNSRSYSGGAFPTQTPFSYQSTATKPVTQSQTPFSYQTSTGQQSNTPLTASSTTPFASSFTAPQNPFSYQTSTGQTNKDYGLAYSAPMQLPQYVYDTIRDIDSYQSQPVQAYKSPRATSSGPNQAIVGRSSQVRGTPNVVAKKAAGGIASLLDKHK